MEIFGPVLVIATTIALIILIIYMSIAGIQSIKEYIKIKKRGKKK